VGAEEAVEGIRNVWRNKIYIFHIGTFCVLQTFLPSSPEPQRKYPSNLKILGCRIRVLAQDQVNAEKPERRFAYGVPFTMAIQRMCLVYPLGDADFEYFIIMKVCLRFI